jgi:hypothetical protein
MTANISFNPFVTTVTSGMFNTSADGLRQGSDMADPSATWRLRGGILAASETLPMWGGVGVYMDVPPYTVGQPNNALGVVMGRANTLTANQAKTLAGFSVFQSNYSWVTTPQSTVPTGGSGSQVNAYPLGSLARIVVACDPALVSLWSGPIKPQVSWDFVNQLLVPYNGSALTIAATGSSYDSVTGVVTLNMSASINFSAGDAIIVSSLTGTGVDLASANGTFTAIAPTTGTTVSYQLDPGLTISSITGGDVTLGSGSASALPVSVLAVKTSNCVTVAYDSATGFATRNYNGACAIIQL